jgi:hypothetical protein
MPLFMISYDEHPTRDYAECYKLLRKWRAKRLLESLWFADLNGTADAVLKAVDAALGNNASVAVVQVFSNGDWSTMAAQKEGVQWLQTHMDS